MPDVDRIDRVSPTLLPTGPHIMWHRWSHLLFLHWALPAESLQSALPPGLNLDTFEGRAYVGLVPFTMTGVRPRFLPSVPGLSNFHEVNVRTYVHRNGSDPGVWFFSLDAANSIAVRLARRTYRLPYHRARMRMTEDAAGTVRYQSERLWPGPLPASCALNYRPDGSPGPAKVGTLEHFLIERYVLYAYANKQLYSARVHHGAYPVQTAVVRSMDETLLAASGFERPAEPPLIHYAREVRVRVYPLTPVAT